MQISRLIELAPKGYDFDGLQPFIFSRSDHLLSDFPDPVENTILACPFPFFSIEVDGHTGIVGDKRDFRSYKDADIMFRCICVKELSPGRYKSLVLIEVWHDDLLVIEQVLAGKAYDGEKDSSPAELVTIVGEMLSRLQVCDTGTTSGTGRVRYKTLCGTKRTFRPKGVIYIGKKNKTAKTTDGHHINWAISWNVRAHWRILANQENMGLDRKGERTVKGFTWIGHYQKGDGPIQDKVRKVI